MLDFNLPSVVLREAWSSVRLDVIRTAVSQTIVELGLVVDQEDQAQSGSGADLTAKDARHMALHLCTIELMNEVGMDVGAVCLPHNRSPPGIDWGPTYSEAVDRYRRVAATSLGTSLGVLRSQSALKGIEP
jgi:hypothetical protein